MKKEVKLKAFVDYTSSAIKDETRLIEIIKQYKDHVTLEYFFAPSENRAPESHNAAKAAIVAHMIGKFREMHRLLLAFEGRFTEEMILQFANEIGLDPTEFHRLYHSKEVEERLQSDIQQANESGLSFFPGITINGHPYNDVWDEEIFVRSLLSGGARPLNRTLKNFFEWGASAAFTLLICSILALLLVNLGFSELYSHWHEMDFGIIFDDYKITLPVEVWVNDVLMAVFFLLIGIEIKREIIDGELSSLRKAAMPLIGALGGMIVPALIYLFFNHNGPTENGWGIPMATDIAFTLGIMALLGSRVPLSLKVFISALAVADDLGAIIVIAVFYGHGFHLTYFLAAIGVALLMLLLNKRNVYNLSPYLLGAIALWIFIYNSGLHATLAGVITAALIPRRRTIDTQNIAAQATAIIESEIRLIEDLKTENTKFRSSSLAYMENSIKHLIGPSERLGHALERIVNYFILPLFAFFNTGIVVVGTDLDLFTSANLGIIFGLVLGKPLGIVLSTWLASKMGIAQLSSDISWGQLIGAATLAGVGFTMSIVVASSAFEGEVLQGAKLSILLASFLAGITGLIILRKTTKVSLRV